MKKVICIIILVIVLIAIRIYYNSASEESISSPATDDYYQEYIFYKDLYEELEATSESIESNNSSDYMDFWDAPDVGYTYSVDGISIRLNDIYSVFTDEESNYYICVDFTLKNNTNDTYVFKEKNIHIADPICIYPDETSEYHNIDLGVHPGESITRQYYFYTSTLNDFANVCIRPSNDCQEVHYFTYLDAIDKRLAINAAETERYYPLINNGELQLP